MARLTAFVGIFFPHQLVRALLKPLFFFLRLSRFA